MKLKKINTDLQIALEENGFTQANELQEATFSSIKSGADCVVIAPDGAGKTTTIVLNVIQRLEKAFEESPRALIFVESREKMLEMESLFEKLGNYTNLRVFCVHEKGDIDYDKNHISLGLDVLIGTPNRLNEMFSSAGFDVNRLKMFIVDDADEILRLRHDTKIARISGSLKTQRLLFSHQVTERIESFSDRIQLEPLWFEADDEEDDEEEFEDEI